MLEVVALDVDGLDVLSAHLVLARLGRAQPLDGRHVELEATVVDDLEHRVHDVHTEQQVDGAERVGVIAGHPKARHADVLHHHVQHHIDHNDQGGHQDHDGVVYLQQAVLLHAPDKDQVDGRIHKQREEPEACGALQERGRVARHGPEPAEGPLHRGREVLQRVGHGAAEDGGPQRAVVDQPLHKDRNRQLAHEGQDAHEEREVVRERGIHGEAQRHRDPCYRGHGRKDQGRAQARRLPSG